MKIKVFGLGAILIAGLAINFQNHTIKADELKPWLGTWDGKMEYLDITTGMEESKRATIKVGPIAGGNKVALQYIYPDDASANFTDTIRVAADGKSVSYLSLKEKKKSSTGLLFILEGETEDAGQKAEMRLSYNFNKKSFSLKKEIRHRGQSEYFTRSEYKLSK